MICFCLKAGIIEEMLEDTFEGMEDDDMEEAAQEEVDKILFEVTKGVKINWRYNSFSIIDIIFMTLCGSQKYPV